MKRFLLTLCALCATTLVWAATWTSDNGITLTYSVYSGKTTITDCNSDASGILEIPDTLGGYPVTAIGEDAFYLCSGLTSVTIPDGVVSIGRTAFRGCSGLTSITIPSSMTSIGLSAFWQCSALLSVTIPSSVTKIDNGVFDSCSSLKSAVISSSLTSTGTHLFNECTSLTSVTIPSSITTIDEFAFGNCLNLTSVTIPSSVTTIKASAFSNCKNLKIDVAEGNPNYTSRDGALFNKDMTMLIRSPGGATSYTIPEGVTSIGSYAFSGCTGLTSVAIPSSVTSIGDYAFPSTTEVSFAGNLIAAKWPAGLDKTLVVSITIPSNVSSIADNAFENCTGVTSVTISESVTSIGYNAFSGCSGLTSITIPNNVKTLARYSFRYCTSLTSVVLPDNVTFSGDAVFEYCTNLQSINLPKNLKTISPWIFNGCTSLKKITIPEGVTSIGSHAFSGCSGLTSVTIPSSVTEIGWEVFSGCSALQAVQMTGPAPSGLTDSGLRGYQVAYPKEYGAEYKAILESSSSYVGVIATADVTVSAEMTTPQTMKVTYSVKSDLPTVKVRAVAFADGVRSFAKIVPVKSGENVPLGGEVSSNMEHTFTWNVASDWDEDLSKVAIEILVQEGELLPQELITIPAVGDNKAMTITLNEITTTMAFNALLWCYAEGDEALTVSNGNVTIADQVVVMNGTDIRPYHAQKSLALLNYLYGKMGYKVLAGDDLTYAKAATRIDFPSSGIFQHAIKIEE